MSDVCEFFAGRAPVSVVGLLNLTDEKYLLVWTMTFKKNISEDVQAWAADRHQAEKVYKFIPQCSSVKSVHRYSLALWLIF